MMDWIWICIFVIFKFKTAFKFNPLLGPMLNTNSTLFWMYNFQESLCADDRMFQHEYPILLRIRCTGPLSLLQDGRQSNMGLLCNNTQTEMIDLALCKWILCGFCWLMGLEANQEWSTLPTHWCLRCQTIICRHQYLQSGPGWNVQHSSSTGVRRGIWLPGACAHERTAKTSSWPTFTVLCTNN